MEKPDPHRRHRGFSAPATVLAALLAAVLLALYLGVLARFPYYFVWDMDQVVCVDQVLIQSGLLPDHLHHPGFGMNLLLAASTRLARNLDVISIRTLNDLRQSLNPLAGMAELTIFVRRHTPFLLLAMVLMLWLAATFLAGGPPWTALSLLSLAALGTLPSLFYEAAMVRTEAYALFFWSASILLIAVAAKVGRGGRRLPLLLASGISLGLCFLTKVHCLLYVVAAPVILLVATCEEGARGGAPASPKDARRGTLAFGAALSVVCAVIFVGLECFAYRVVIPQGVPIFTKRFQVSPLAILFPASMLALAVVQFAALARPPAPRPIARASALLSALGGGFLLAFALHFLIYADPRQSFTYLLYDLKMAFLRETYSPIPKVYFPLDPPRVLRWNAVPLAINLALLAALFWARRADAIPIPIPRLAFYASASALAIANVAIGSRYFLRDLLVAELLVAFLTVAYAGTLVNGPPAGRLRRARVLLAGLAMAAVLTYNLARARWMPERLNANYNLYGWMQEKWLQRSYSGNQVKYEEIMSVRYADPVVRAQAKRVAPSAADVRRTVAFVFPNQSVSLRNIGVFAEGFPVWTKDLGWRLTETPLQWRGAILVDNVGLPARRAPLFKPELVREHSEVLDKLRNIDAAATPPLAVLPRTDLRILLFVPVEETARLATLGLVSTEFQAAVEKQRQAIRFQALDVNQYTEIPESFLPPESFFVIVPADLSA